MSFLLGKCLGMLNQTERDLNGQWSLDFWHVEFSYYSCIAWWQARVVCLFSCCVLCKTHYFEIL